ncbi:AAA family ATPase [Alysiella filiformis]|uniref:MoxR-like ATPase n=1 Tax=Alysiella filiformis DSM 16848 TaxID=1120981 RepID=A0A286EIZ0_9NEIS|nr:AAA family ATPase [Alysiella filiformis]QMT30726.1 AAA family ATPase [Alysiella filiformis]UBQ56294.1 AAA family ATPase [Alysiella filiformis DSM 16848]SOD70907.1 MoxR-like ATPase [Alysiella filiformis DSM 16848]
MNMKTKLSNLLSELNHGFIGREEMVKSALLSMIAGENLLLIGPPGTGKSLIARQISQALAQPETPNQAYFEYLLTKFSTPEELFGPLSISELKQDRFHRNTQGYLPTVQVAFLDEIFKASSSILNALLTILNERKFHNGTQTQNIPLQALIAASNELPKGQAELSALYDRFLVRRFVDYVGENQLKDFFNLPEKRAISPENQLSRDELAEIQQNAAKVVFPEPIQAALLAIWAKHKETFKENADERLSDRRFAKILHLLRISAFTNQREQVDLSDLFLLKDCLWNDETNAEKVRNLIMGVLRKYAQNGKKTSNPNIQAAKKHSVHEIRVPPENNGNIITASIAILPSFSGYFVVKQIHVKIGDSVEPDQSLVMVRRKPGKLDFDIPSPVAGVVKAIHAKVGDEVLPDSIIVEIVETVSVDEPESNTQSLLVEQFKNNIWL